MRLCLCDGVQFRSPNVAAIWDGDPGVFLETGFRFFWPGVPGIVKLAIN